MLPECISGMGRSLQKAFIVRTLEICMEEQINLVLLRN
jgi:hypothetical protein